MSTPSQCLAEFAANLRFEEIPEAVIQRCEELLIDTFGSMYAGSTERAVQTLQAFALTQDPSPVSPC